jgi:hypothetical protein
VEEAEEARVAELAPALAEVEVGQGEEEVGERGVLAAEEAGEAEAKLAMLSMIANVANRSDKARKAN